jgi:phosphate transport system substrate-binding protein
MRTSIRIFLAGLLAVSVAACGSGNSSSTAASGAASPAMAGGGITIAGSTALLPLVKQAIADYATAHPDAKIDVSGGGSRVGITQAAQGGVDIGDSDIPPVGQPGLVDHRVAVVMFDVVANPTVGVSKLAKGQIQDIFSGRVTNWKQVGGKDQAITIINRPRSSGTRAVFVQKLMNGAQPNEAGLTQDSSGTVASMVGQTPGAISYVASGYVKPPSITPIVIDGVAPTAANVANGTYPFWSFEHMLTKGTPSQPVAAFITFVSGDKTALGALGFIPTSAVKSP